MRSGRYGPFGLALRLGGLVVAAGFLLLLVATLVSEGGRPGALVVTFIYVVVGVGLQFALEVGAGDAGRPATARTPFFRVVFLIPMTITPVGVGYMFKMMTDTSKGPLEPLWVTWGYRTSWVTDPWLAGCSCSSAKPWQWTPFMFIVLLAALEARDKNWERRSSTALAAGRSSATSTWPAMPCRSSTSS